MDWVDRPQNSKGLYGILQLLQGSHLNNFMLKTLKLGWVVFHSLTFQFKCLDFQSNNNKKLAPMLSRFCNWLCDHLLKEAGHVLLIGSLTHSLAHSLDTGSLAGLLTYLLTHSLTHSKYIHLMLKKRKEILDSQL